MFIGNYSWGFQDFFPDLQVIEGLLGLQSEPCCPALGVALCFPAPNLNWRFKSNFGWAAVTPSVRKFRHYSHRPSRWLPSRWESLGFSVPAACERRAGELADGSQPLLHRLSWHISAVLPGIGDDITTHWGYAGAISSLTSPALSCLWQSALFLYMVTVLLIFSPKTFMTGLHL